MSDLILGKQNHIKTVVSDELLIRSEIYNGNDYDVVFLRMQDKDKYVRGSGVTPGPDYVICRSKEHCILPTSYYVPRFYDKGHVGEPDHEIHIEMGEAKFIRNYGDQIGKQNVLPSAPEVRGVIRRRRK